MIIRDYRAVAIWEFLLTLWDSALLIILVFYIGYAQKVWMDSMQSTFSLNFSFCYQWPKVIWIFLIIYYLIVCTLWEHNSSFIKKLFWKKKSDFVLSHSTKTGLTQLVRLSVFFVNHISSLISFLLQTFILSQLSDNLYAWI